MRSVRISWKHAQAAYSALSATRVPGGADARLALESALAPKRSVVAAKKRKTAKKRTKRAETSDIRAAVMKRANYCCERCGKGEASINPLTLDHMFGRRIEQTERNTWSLCFSCHRSKTNNEPSAASWLMAFAQHAQFHSYTREQQMALKRMAFVEARNELSAGVSR